MWGTCHVPICHVPFYHALVHHVKMLGIRRGCQTEEAWACRVFLCVCGAWGPAGDRGILGAPLLLGKWACVRACMAGRAGEWDCLSRPGREEYGALIRLREFLLPSLVPHPLSFPGSLPPHSVHLLLHLVLLLSGSP